MRGVNKVILVGNLGRDPEVRYTAAGTAVAKVSLATSESWRDKTTGELQEQTEWHRVVFYGQLAETVGTLLHKGSKVFVEGSLHTRKWQDKESGQDRYITEIKGASMQKVDSAKETPSTAANDASFPAYEEVVPQAAPRRGMPLRTKGSAAAATAYDLDDEIPF